MPGAFEDVVALNAKMANLFLGIGQEVIALPAREMRRR